MECSVSGSLLFSGVYLPVILFSDFALTESFTLTWLSPELLFIY